MLLTLAFRHLWVRKLRALVLLLGFSLGVAVMVVLLSVGQAMLEQSRDVSLIGGGEVTILPQGIDIEAMRTGGLGAMFFGIDRARFLTRQALGGPRHAGLVRILAPAIEGKLLYLCRRDDPCEPTPVRAGAEVPSRARALGAGLDVQEGRWEDSASDSAYVAPTPQQLYDEIDRFHLPRNPDSTWGEWHYFNVVAGPDTWWYITFLVGGEVPPSLPDTGHGRRWGGRVLISHRRPDGRYDRFAADAAAPRVRFDTSRADLVIGGSSVGQRNGTYYLSARAAGTEGPIVIDLALRPEPERYFPPVELQDDGFLSGYVVPALRASASGQFCVAGRCASVTDAPAYHDHNWGVWHDATWEWGAARGSRMDLLYGGVYREGAGRADAGAVAASPFFLTLVDSLGVRQVLRFAGIRYAGEQSAAGAPGALAPASFDLEALRGADTVRLHVDVEHALATAMAPEAVRRYLLQMRGRFRASGSLAGESVADSGMGFFETYRRR